MKKTFTLLVTTFILNFFTGQIPLGYYDSTTGLTGYSLKTKLKEIITLGHKDNGYDGLWNAYKIGDLDKFYENDNSILDVYSEKPLSADAYSYIPGTNQCGSYNGEGKCYNREHLFPQGFFNSAAPMKNDYLHILPTDGYVNGRRSNYPFGKVGTATWTSTNGSKLGSSIFPGYSGTVFEPIDEFKGDIARSLLYFITRYEDQLPSFDYNDVNNPQDGSKNRGFDQWYINLLLQWHQNDPVSPKEIARNNYAYVYQKNRNPYIDHPEYVGMIWTSTLSTGEDQMSKNMLSVYPNPVHNGQLFISGNLTDKAREVKIYSMDGKLLQSEKLDSSNKIQLKSRNKGTYILTVGDQRLRFIVE